jgi:hypothetical protein
VLPASQPLASDAPAGLADALRIIFGGPIGCPSCECVFIAEWTTRDEEPQQCPACEAVFQAAWPGFPIEPETIVVVPSGRTT